MTRKIDTLLAICEWQINHIKTSKEQARNSNFVEESVWRKALRRNVLYKVR